MKKDIEILIYGATGFTGQRVAKLLSQKFSTKKAKWAIAGRNAANLQKISDQLTGSKPEIRVVKVQDEQTLRNAFEDVKLVLNCAGPFTLTGKNIVSACIESQSHYLDITGEPLFMNSTALEFDASAKRAGILVIHACGFDSIPAEVGWIRLMREFDLRGVKPTNIESYVSLVNTGSSKTVWNHTTLESAVLSFAQAKEISSTARKLREMRGKDLPRRFGRSFGLKKLPHFEKRINQWVQPFFGADSAVVRNSQSQLSLENPTLTFPRYWAYFGSKRIRDAVKELSMGVIVLSMVPLPLGRRLLKRYPEIFSFGRFAKTGPTEKEMAETFFQMDLFGNGDGIKDLHVRIFGPEPGYVATPLMLLEAADCVLEERDKLPTGGVFTPGAAFFNTSLEDRIKRAGIQVDVVHM